MSVVRRTRETFHPLLHLRRFAPARSLLRAVDRPVWSRLKALDKPVCVRLVSHASFIALGTTEPKVVALMRRLLREHEISRFWDVGANFGYYAWLAKSIRPDVEVTLVEPEPANLALIRATLARHGVDGVRVLAAAASDVNGEATFMRDFDGALCGTLETLVVESRALLRVPTLRLDSLDGPVDLIKIDVEGHEEQVLAGAEITIARHRPIVVLECVRDGTPAVHALERRGYRAEQIDRDNYVLVPNA
jgi:FkbM family methyltransferase